MTSSPNRGELGTIATKIGNAVVHLKYLPRVFSLVWTASKGWTVAWAVLLILQGLFPVATVYLTRIIVDAVMASVEAGGTWETVVQVLWPAGAMGLVVASTEIARALLGMVREYQAELIQDEIAHRIHHTSTEVDLSFYETPDYFNHLHRARTEAWYRPLRLIDNTGAFVQSGITLLAMVAVLLGFSGWIPGVLIASTIPAFVVVVRHAVRQHRSRIQFTPEERRIYYYDHEMTSRETAAELRLWGLSDFFGRRYKDARGRLRKERFRLLRHRSVAEMGAAIFALIAAAGCMAFMGYRTLHGELSLGELAMFFAAFRQGQQMMRGLLRNAGDIYRNVLFLGDLFEFLGLKSVIHESSDPKPVPIEIIKGISFRDVQFTYPGSDRAALRGFNLDLGAKKMVAIVGPNGSGKSTVVRLLSRFYDPESGHIEIDGTDLRDFRVNDLRNAITVMFQRPVQYNLTAGENIALGDLANRTGAESPEIHHAAVAAGFDRIAAKLPSEYETLLGKWFKGGTELSVGEWQRIALARALIRKSQIVILDEPTSAMDSWAEADWMARLREIVRGSTTLIITHRFSTAMRADEIHVMRNGRITESGTHETLLKRNGHYAQSWNSQSSKQGQNPNDPS